MLKTFIVLLFLCLPFPLFSQEQHSFSGSNGIDKEIKSLQNWHEQLILSYDESIETNSGWSDETKQSLKKAFRFDEEADHTNWIQFIFQGWGDHMRNEQIQYRLDRLLISRILRIDTLFNAALEKNPDAYYRLGVLNLVGYFSDSNRPDYPTGDKFLIAAAHYKHAPSLYQLAHRYLRVNDFSSAIKAFDQANELGYFIGYHYSQQAKIYQSLNENKESSIEWMISKAQILEEHPNPNYEGAIRLVKKIIKKGRIDLYVWLTDLYRQSDNERQGLKSASKAIKKLNGMPSLDVNQKYALGYCYFIAKEYQKSFNKNRDIYLEVLKKDDSVSREYLDLVRNNIAYSFEEGTGVRQNIDSAIFYYKEGALENDGPSNYALARIYNESPTHQQADSTFKYMKISACSYGIIGGIDWMMKNYPSELADMPLYSIETDYTRTHKKMEMLGRSSVLMVWKSFSGFLGSSPNNYKMVKIIGHILTIQEAMKKNQNVDIYHSIHDHEIHRHISEGLADIMGVNMPLYWYNPQPVFKYVSVNGQGRMFNQFQVPSRIHKYYNFYQPGWSGNTPAIWMYNDQGKVDKFTVGVTKELLLQLENFR